MGQSLKTWVVGTTLLCVVVLGLGGFLVVKPQFDQASDLDEQTAQLVVSNDTLAADVAALKAQFARIDEYRAALAEARVKIPEAGEISDLLREIQAVAESTGVTLVTSSPGSAQAYVAPETTEASSDEATADPAATEPTADPTADAADPAAAEDVESLLEAAAAEIADVDGLYSIPVTIDVVGSYDEVRAFIDALQKGTQRYFLAGDLTMTRLDASDASGGRPAVEDGDVEIAMAVAAFALTPTSGTSSTTAEEPGTMPEASAGKNPFSAQVSGAEG